MNASAQPGDSPVSDSRSDLSLQGAPEIVPKPNAARPLEEQELDAALQLLVERAQYITGATGTALALPHGDEMVCRASAGSCAPSIGARLQVRSGLTGESIARRQILRCDNAEADPRVNLETCHALGIASIVVLPLLRRNGEVRGLFELFSDHPYAFEERDLIALERMADLTITALDLAEQRHGSVPPPPPEKQPEAKQVEAKQAETKQPELPLEETVTPATSLDPPLTPSPEASAPILAEPTSPQVGLIQSTASEPVAVGSPEIVRTASARVYIAPAAVPAEPPEMPSPELVPALETILAKATVPEAMRRVQKCSACGFPVSEGRTLCLDCEKKESDKKLAEKKQSELKEIEAKKTEIKSGQPDLGDAPNAQAVEPSEPAASEEVLPPFLANAQPVEESWLANHVNLLAILVLIVGILVAVVVFR